MQFTLPQKMKFLNIHTVKYVQHLYVENSKIMMNRIKADLNKLKDVSFSWTGKFNIAKVLILFN